MPKDQQRNGSVCQRAKRQSRNREYRLAQRIDIAEEPFDQGHITEGFYDTALNEASDA
ncbi:hypothetical protein [Rhodopirellula halodulae]|uniref:hypothetical protein n=1 Tax=Rhodopirellula halodulae TaxID=2894198 RepID=UPI001E5880E1|nr:hypothetical protein [Rhodopirellula sp. JC737]MCC9657971.1 hypothetical protein [Rhodopirellula sp. JC737]